MEANEPPTSGRLVGLEPGRGEWSEAVLSLSGGGYRAALFHLGALTRLNELGLLARIDTVGAVGGGSIIAALLAARVPWPLQGAFPGWEVAVAGPMREIAGRSQTAGRAADPAREERYARELAASLGAELPERPRFVFGGAGLALGRMSVADGAEPAGGVSWKIGDAVGWPGYDAALVEDVIAAVRTDLDALEEGEQAVLENHGYLLAAVALRECGSAGAERGEPLTPPFPKWMDEARVRVALAASSRRTRLGRTHLWGGD